MKKCPECGKNKELIFFCAQKDKPSGKRSSCTDCYNKKRREYTKTPKGKYTEYKKGAKKRGFSFSITLDQFMDFWNKDCFYCGDAIDGIGLDRVDSSIGYNLENVVSCCYRCNWMKMTSSYESFIDQCRKIVERHKMIV